MRILQIHTHYQQPGGEEQSFNAEVTLLRNQGHRIMTLEFHNRDLETFSPVGQAVRTFWNREAYAKVRKVISIFGPHVVHIHNTFPLASPAVIWAAKAEGVPVVVTLHNYRLLCLNGLFFRQERVCEDCLGRMPWRGVVRGCYRRSRLASGVVAGMLSLHRVLGTWELVDRFIVLTEFARQKFLEAGLPSHKLVLKPNFVYPDPGPGEGRGGYALFVGRLSPEKGIRTLLEAWRLLGGRFPLKIVGEGPLRLEVEEAARSLPGLEYLGPQEPEAVYRLMGEAAFLVFPSEWYETFGRVAVEAFAKGTPVLAAQIGAVAELTEHGRTGLYFRPGDPQDLATKAKWLFSHPQEMGRMRREARAEYEAKYTAERNYEILVSVYHSLVGVGDEK